MRTGALILVLSLALGGCGKKAEDQGGGGAPPPAGGGGEGEKAAALKAAWEADTNCQNLEKCCEVVKGTGWEQTIGLICKSLETYKNFEEQAKNLMDPAGQAQICKATLQNAAMQGNDANPVPEPCAAAGKMQM